MPPWPRPALAAKFTDTEHTRIEEPRPPGVPSDAVLEAEGAVIGSIHIDIRNIFDETIRAKTTSCSCLPITCTCAPSAERSRRNCCSRAATATTRQALEETERNLRKLIYVYDAHVVPVRYADGKVDIEVITKDVWTLNPGISFSRAGGTNSTGYKLQDSNFLGWGKTADDRSQQ